LADFILVNAIVFHMQWEIKKNLVVFNLVDFCNSPNCQNKFCTKFSSYTVCYVNLKEEDLTSHKSKITSKLASPKGSATHTEVQQHSGTFIYIADTLYSVNF